MALDEPVLIKAGDTRVKLGYLSAPPLVDCRVLSEDYYQQMLKELTSLKKVYNDLAESHAKQVIELASIKNDNEELKLSSQYRYDALLKSAKEVDFWETEWKMKDKVVSECFIEANINYQRYAEKISYLESELLKAKDLISRLFYKKDVKFYTEIEAFLNEKP